MTLGLAQRQGVLLDEVTRFCDAAVAEDSVFALLHRERDNLFPDEFFADLFTATGRRSVPPSIVACVIVLQKLGGLSDREAVDRFTYDARWRYAAGVGGWDQGPTGFAHTVLVDMRARLRASGDRDRIKRATTGVAAAAGLLGLKRALDSAPLFDAVATMDTVTLVRSAVRALLRVCAAGLEAEVRAVLGRDDDYAAAGKPPCDWDDAQAREQLVDALVRDGLAALGVLEGRALPVDVVEAAQLLATVVGQDVEEGGDGVFRIARRVARDRVISTVDPDARHGHKTTSRRYDGYKGHVAVDPDSEIVTQTAVSAANVGDAQATEALLGEFAAPAAGQADAPDHAGDSAERDAGRVPDGEPVGVGVGEGEGEGEGECEGVGVGEGDDGPTVYGDAAYGSGDNLALLQRMGAQAMAKVAAATAPGGTPPRSPAPPDRPRRCGSRPTATAPPRSARCARTARCASSAPLRPAAAASTSGRTKRCSPPNAPAKRTPPGRPTTAPTGRRSNANSPTLSAAGTAAAAPGCAADNASPKTGTSTPPRTTWHAWPCSACAKPPPDGKQPPPEKDITAADAWPRPLPARPEPSRPEATVYRTSPAAPAGPGRPPSALTRDEQLSRSTPPRLVPHQPPRR